jgi:hypothetical protein
MEDDLRSDGSAQNAAADDVATCAKLVEKLVGGRSAEETVDYFRDELGIEFGDLQQHQPEITPKTIVQVGLVAMAGGDATVDDMKKILALEAAKFQRLLHRRAL